MRRLLLLVATGILLGLAACSRVPSPWALTDVRGHLPDLRFHLIDDRGRPVSGSRVLLLGLAYKKNTGDARESPAVRVATLLRRMGADVVAADPHVAASGLIDSLVERVEPTPDEVGAAGRVAWQVLAGAALHDTAQAGPAPVRGRLRYAGAPLDVGYAVASWSA